MKYKLNVYCRLNGMTQDAGTHATCESETDEAAVAELRPKLMRLFSYYDEIEWSITDEAGRKVK